MAGESNGTKLNTAPLKIQPVANPLADTASEIASNITYHAHYTPHFSPFKFEPEQAYYATADSVRDRLIHVWYHIFPLLVVQIITYLLL